MISNSSPVNRNFASVQQVIRTALEEPELIMAKITEQTATHKRMQVNALVVDTIDQEKLWVHYDDEADSMVIYITGAPVFANCLFL